MLSRWSTHLREGVAPCWQNRGCSQAHLRVGILGLDEELDALDGGGRRLGDGARHTTLREEGEEIGSVL